MLRGELLDIAVLSRTPGDRAALVRVSGSLGFADIPATQARALLGLRSTWFSLTRTPEPAANY